MLTSFLTAGNTSKLVGNPTRKPIAKPRANLKAKSSAKPEINAVIVNVIVESIAKVMNKAISSIEYFPANFITIPQSKKCSMKHLTFLCTKHLESV